MPGRIDGDGLDEHCSDLDDLHATKEIDECFA